LFGQPTPLGAQELTTERSSSNAHTLTTDLNRFFLIFFLIYINSNGIARKYSINKYL